MLLSSLLALPPGNTKASENKNLSSLRRAEEASSSMDSCREGSRVGETPLVDIPL
jgi:hypothetical protein